MSRQEKIVQHMTEIAEAFKQLLEASCGEKNLMEGQYSEQVWQQYEAYHAKRVRLLDHIGVQENKIQKLTGLELPPYQYKADVFYNREEFEHFSALVERISRMINEILQNDLVIEDNLKKNADKAAAELKHLVQNRKVMNSYYNSGPPPQAIFFDRKK